ncbi:hypothetical protein [Mucilaginibacter paludis]|uniref:Uncharacterized protein n=1 Tax=Mucilaginibacter paludis DSM 18603 TaxID=714943 RepID=H1Y4K7_9SPHI|nr:hypothetical protein [Mucilaginibacter paludis]EHQ26791.1 hypothetical protein Mucpa_2678 [Mucilaginibacter paludis DSM 18603]
MSNLKSYQFFFEKVGFFKKVGSVKLKKRYWILLAGIIFYFLAALIRVPTSSVTAGFFAGECIGRCNATDVITDHAIRVDEISNVDTIPSIHKTIRGDFSELKFNVPLLLLFHFTGSFGQPDSHDQGGYILGFKLLGIPFSYDIDKGSEPWYFTDMTDLVRDRLRKINNEILYHYQVKP